MRRGKGRDGRREEDEVVAVSDPPPSPPWVVGGGREGPLVTYTPSTNFTLVENPPLNQPFNFEPMMQSNKLLRVRFG